MATSSSAEPKQEPEPDEPTFRFDQNNTSTQSLLSGAGSGYESQYGSLFGSRFSLTDGSGIYISSLALTIIISAIAVIGIVLVAVIITLAVMLSSCEQNASVNLQVKGTTISCSSFRLNTELNNIQERAPPPTCNTEILEYIHGGQYLKDVEMAVDSARSYLKSLMLEGNKKLGVILDIDETAISNIFYYQSRHYRPPVIWDQSLGLLVNSNKATPMLPILHLYNEVRAANWSVFFVSERPESALELTIRNLEDSGYGGWHGLFLRSAVDAQSSVQAYKSNRRIEIQEQGYQIACVIGDQWADVVGPATGNRTFKLPNPMYQIL